MSRRDFALKFITVCKGNYAILLFFCKRKVIDIANNKITLKNLSISNSVYFASGTLIISWRNLISGTALPIGQSRTIRAKAGVSHASGRHEAGFLQRRCPRAGAMSAQLWRLAAQHSWFLQSPPLLGGRYQRLRLPVRSHPGYWSVFDYINFFDFMAEWIVTIAMSIVININYSVIAKVATSRFCLSFLYIWRRLQSFFIYFAVAVLWLYRPG